MKWLKRIFLLALVLTACGQAPQELPPIAITVDPTLEPTVTALPGFEDGEPRPLATVTGEDGVTADFVVNEVWLATDNDAEVQAFLGRWQGKVLKTIKPSEAGVPGLAT